MTRVNTEEELGKALEDDSMEIYIENPVLGKVVIIIKKAGKTKWLVAVGAIAVTIFAIVSMLPAAGTGPAAPVTESILVMTAGATASAAVAILGLTVTIAAIIICLKSKSTKVLAKLRNEYIISDNRDGVIVLTKKKNVINSKNVNNKD